MSLAGSYWIYGYVEDESGAVSGAIVSVSTESYTTGADGYYQINLQNVANDGDTITVSCEISGKTSSGQFVLDVGNLTNKVDFQMQADDISISDMLSTVHDMTASLSDSVSISDSLSVNHDMTLELDDSVSISDALGIKEWYSTSDSVSISDSLSAVMNPLVLTSPCTNVYLLINWAGQENTITKDIVVFNFWVDTDLETIDKGINAKPLILKGIISDSIPVVVGRVGCVNNINAIMNTGTEVTINTEGGCIDGVYIIKSFSYSTIKGLADTFSFTLQLEFVRDI